MKLHSFFTLLICGAISVAAVHIATAQTPVRKMTGEEYIERYKSIAIEHMEYYGIPASITLAQGMLESGNGNSTLARESNNHFGIKCHSDWQGEVVYHDDDAPGECFRKYDNPEESYRDHAEYLCNHRNNRYDSLFNYSASDYEHWAHGLKAAGYATAPDYAERLIALIERYDLHRFDCDDIETPDNRQDDDRNKGVTDEENDNKNGNIEDIVNPSFRDESDELAVPGINTIDPDRHCTTVGVKNGYNIYRCNGVHYVKVKKDECFETLAPKFRLSARSVRRFNELPKDAQPDEGDVVFIERKGDRWEGRNILYIVSGQSESLGYIAHIHGLRTRTLARLNAVGRDAVFERGRSVKLR